MVRGLCVNCGKQVGGFLRPKGWRCPSCGKAYCENCSPKIGVVFKKPTCPTCGVQLEA